MNAVRATILSVMVFFSAHADAEEQGRRVALVVGNGAYSSVPALANPRNDAEDVSALLEKLGFNVLLGTDLDRAGMVALIGRFLEQAAGSDAAVFYYAGHGVQFGGDNYFLPTDVTVGSAYELKTDALSMQTLVSEIENVSRVNLIFVDACRDNPLSRRIAAVGRSATPFGRGLARIEPRGTDTFIAYATAPGDVAFDGSGRNSPFASAFLSNVAASHDEISILFKEIARDVVEETNGAQRPQIVSGMTVNFYFQGNTTVDVKAGSSDAQAAYDAASQIGTEQAFQAIVDSFPDTVQAKLALAAIDSLRGKKAEAESTRPPVPPSADAPDKAEAAPADQQTQVATLPPPQIEEALGLSRQQRQSVQRALDNLGYDPGPADGQLGDRTRNALKRYQAALGEAETGYLSQDLLDTLDLAAIGPQRTLGGSTARSYTLTELPENVNPRFRNAVSTLNRYELNYGYYGGHLYVAVLSWGLGWDSSEKLAESAGGHLVTLSSRAENEFVYGLFAHDDRFVQLTEDGQKNGPWIGLYQLPGSHEPKDGWRWVTDEPVAYTAWTRDQPNNYGGHADVAHYYSYGRLSPGEEQRAIRWDDQERDYSRGFILEVE